MTQRLESFFFGVVGILAFAPAVSAQPEPAAADAPATAVPPPPAAEPVPQPTPPPDTGPALTTREAPLATEPSAPPPAVIAPEPAPAGPPSFKVESADGKSHLKLGFLFQPQFQALGDVARDSYAMNLYLRRMRLMAGGNLHGIVDFTFYTDFANLFRANPPTDPAAPPSDRSIKATPGMNIQGAFVSLRPFGDVFKVDAGYMLPPLSHNALQSAGTLYSWDYFSSSFLHSNAFGSSADPVGRDTGVQLRGLVLDNHLEYRVGLFQGLRDGQTATEVGSNNMFRLAGRVQINVFEPETGFYYAGSYLGTKTILSIGGSFDIQDDYKYYAADVFADLPVGPGVATAQVNFAHWDGGDFIPALINQSAVMAEAGFHFTGVKLGPIVRFERLTTDPAGVPDQTRWSAGVAYWPYGHTMNLKAFFSQLTVEDADHAANQLNLQWQVYVF